MNGQFVIALLGGLYVARNIQETISYHSYVKVDDLNFPIGKCAA